MKRYIRSTSLIDNAESILHECLDVFYDVIGEVWPNGEIHETVYGCNEVYSLATYTREEAAQAIAELNDALTAAGLRQYITKIESFGSELFTERPLRILMRFKRSVSCVHMY